MQHIHEKGCNINRRKNKLVRNIYIYIQVISLYLKTKDYIGWIDGIRWNVRNNINKSNNFRKKTYLEMISLKSWLQFKYNTHFVLSLSLSEQFCGNFRLSCKFNKSIRQPSIYKLESLQRTILDFGH